MHLSTRRDYHLLTGVIALVYGATGISAPLLVLFLEELGADYGQIAQVLTTFAVVFLVSNYLWGQATDRWGHRKPLLVAGLLAMAGLYGLLSQAPTLGWAWLFHALQGLALAAYTTPSLALMGDILEGEGRRGRRMGGYRGVASLAFAAAAVAGGYIADSAGLDRALALCGLLYGLAGGVGMYLREAGDVPLRTNATAPPDDPTGKQPGTQTVRAARGPGQETHPRPEDLAGARLPIPFLLGVALWMAAHVAGASVWPNFMASLGYTKSSIASLWGLAALVEFPAMGWSGLASDRLGRIPLLVAGSLGNAGVLVGYLLLARFFLGLLGIQLLRGFAFASYTATAMVFAAEWGPKGSRGRNTGLFHAASGLGQVAGTFLGGTLAQHLEFGWLYGICAGLALGAGVSFMLGGRQGG